jgi:hypothetical protein
MGGRTLETDFVDESERGFKYDPASVYHKDKYMVVQRPSNNFIPKKKHNRVFSTDYTYTSQINWDAKTPMGSVKNGSATQKANPDYSKLVFDQT